MTTNAIKAASSCALIASTATPDMHSPLGQISSSAKLPLMYVGIANTAVRKNTTRLARFIDSFALNSAARYRPRPMANAIVGL